MEINWLTLIVLLLGGLSLFLYGMTVMTNALKAAAGSLMKNFLKSMTRNRWTSLLAGTGITAIIQSSSVTTVLAVGFVSAGLLSFQSTLGVILGANLGTTITAQIIAFKITKASWLMIAFGYLFSLVFSKKAYRDIGYIILGLGMVFLGMTVMSEATDPLKNYQPFLALMEGLDNYYLAILVGTLFTALVQSSSATTGVVIVMASQGLISVDGGIAVIMGANIGTCITAVLSALGKPRSALRVAVSHIFFNVLGVLVWLWFIPQLTEVVQFLSANDNARQIANAHTLFNVANTLLFIWFVKPVAKLVQWITPDKKKSERILFPELHNYFLENTSIALELVSDSIGKLGKRTLKIVSQGFDVATKGNEKQLHILREKDVNIDRGHREILLFIQKIQLNEMTESEAKLLENQLEAVNVLESAADLITTNLVEAAEHRIENGFESSEETKQKFKELYMIAEEAFELALAFFCEKPVSENSRIDKTLFKEKLKDVRVYLAKRLSNIDENRIAIYRFESEMLETIRRLHALARRLERKAG